MKQALLSAGAAVILATAAFATPAAAQHRGVGGGGVNMSSGMGGRMGGAPISSGGMSTMGAGRISGTPSGGPSVRRFSGPVSGRISGPVSGNIGVAHSWNGRNWTDHHHRRHFRGPGFAFGFGFGAPYYDYSYYDDTYYDDGCYRLRRVWTPYGWQLHRVWVCDVPYAAYYPY